MIDVIREIEAVQREVGEGRIPAGEGKAIRLRREYDAPIEDVWDALTRPDRINRWFLPISGDFRIGGRFQLEGNAGGEIVACERPNRLKITWAYGENVTDADVSEVEVRLASVDAETTRFELEHVAVVPEEFWDQYGPGAVGVGWDGAVLGLGLHLAGGSIDDPTSWPESAEGREFNTRSSQAWGVAYAASGASPDSVERAVAGSIAFYVPPPEATDVTE